VGRRWRIADTDWNHWPQGLADREVWAAAAAAGLDGIEIGVYAAGRELTPDRITRLEALAAEYQVPVAGILLSLPAGKWPHGALAGQAGAVAGQVVACALACARLGIETLGLWSGADLPAAPHGDVADGLARCRDAAARHGVRIAVEYKPGTAIPDCPATIGLLDEVPGTGALMDLGHVFAGGEDPVAVIGELGSRLWHVHLGDAAPGQEDDDLPLGQVHDARPAIAALDDAGFAGVASFDLYGAACSPAWTGRDAVAESLRHLRTAA
jgi:sugar phosphate isomerase/epimerase